MTIIEDVTNKETGEKLSDEDAKKIREWAMNLEYCPVCDEFRGEKVVVMWVAGKLECHECGFHIIDLWKNKDKDSGVM